MAPDASEPSSSPSPEMGVPSALPPLGLRIGAFVAIVVAGICGALIGYAFADLQCVGDCSTWRGIGTLVGAGIAAIGVTIVVVLALRAMDEWQTIQKRDGQKRDGQTRDGSTKKQGNARR